MFNKTNRDIFINIVSSILTMILSALVLLYVYRIANQKLGVEKIGLWSIIMSITAFGNIGTFGFSGSLVKFTAELHAKGERYHLPGVLNSCVILMSGLLIVFLLLIYGASFLFLDQIVDHSYIPLAFSVLPLSFSIFFTSTLGYMVLSVIEGLNKNWQKNLMIVVGNCLLLVFTILWIPRYGLYGIFYAQMIQAGFLLLSAFAIVKWNVPEYSIIALNKDRKLLKNIMGYGVMVQSQTILNMLSDPITKMFLSRYGGLSYVGVYEMASRVVLQARSILLAIMSNLLPKLVHLHSSNEKERINHSFRNVYSINFDLFALCFGMLFLYSPVLVTLWLQKPEPELTWVIQILTIGWFINSASVVPYIFNLSSGILKSNVISHATIAGLNFTLGIVIILLRLKPYFFIYSWIIALSVGSLYVLFEYEKRNVMATRKLITKDNLWIITIIVLNIIIMKVFLMINIMPLILAYSISLLLFGFMVLMYIRKSDTLKLLLIYISTFSRYQLVK